MMTGHLSDSPRTKSQYSSTPVLPARRLAAGAALAALLCSCSTPALHSARHNYYRGNLAAAEESLSDGTKLNKNDTALVLMERATIRQARGEYDASSADYINAYNELQRLETYSLSKGTASLVVNDGVQDYIGTPYERILLHAFTAKNHFAEAHWDNAAVEARRIIIEGDPEKVGDYPVGAYSRYLAGFALEMIDDPSNAAIQYRKANNLLEHVEINEVTGYLRRNERKILPTNSVNDISAVLDPHEGKGPPAPDPWPPQRYENELVCFILLDRSPMGSMLWSDQGPAGAHPTVEIQHQGRKLGEGFLLSDTSDLAFRTIREQAAVKAAKTVARVVIKEATAQAIENSTNELVGDMVRLILIGLLERPDVRRWETLPRWLCVARVPCPPDLEEFDVVLKNPAGKQVQTIHVTQPIQKRRNIFVSFCRDLPIPSTLPPLPPRTAVTAD